MCVTHNWIKVVGIKLTVIFFFLKITQFFSQTKTNLYDGSNACYTFKMILLLLLSWIDKKRKCIIMDLIFLTMSPYSLIIGLRIWFKALCKGIFFSGILLFKQANVCAKYKERTQTTIKTQTITKCVFANRNKSPSH